MDTPPTYRPLDVAERIKMQAKAKDVAVKTMLSELSLNKNTVSDMRRGFSLSFERLARIADYLDCSIDYLVGRTDNPDINK